MLDQAGYSNNQLSIVGFVISLGLLVDDAFVVVEQAERHLREGKDPIPAAIDSRRPAVRSSTARSVGRGPRSSGANTSALAGQLAERLGTLVLPAGAHWELAGEAESQRESFGGVGTAAIVAAFGILAVLVLEFRTFRGTLVVASVIPLGIAGGLWALLLTGNTLSFTATILLVDFANQLRQSGMPLDEAIAKAGEIRFLPILLTTATALGGLVPLAAEGSALYSPLAYVIIGGLLSSTLLARIVTPVAYKLLAPPLETDLVPVPVDGGWVTA